MRTTIEEWQSEESEPVSQEVEESYESEGQSSYFDADAIDSLAKKTAGLFSNIIKKMDMNRQKE
jgi:hypothetical protein